MKSAFELIRFLSFSLSILSIYIRYYQSMCLLLASLLRYQRNYNKLLLFIGWRNEMPPTIVALMDSEFLTLHHAISIHGICHFLRPFIVERFNWERINVACFVTCSRYCDCCWCEHTACVCGIEETIIVHSIQSLSRWFVECRTCCCTSPSWSCSCSCPCDVLHRPYYIPYHSHTTYYT